LRKFLFWTFTLILGVVAGGGSALYFTGMIDQDQRLGEDIEIGDWSSNWTIGTDGNDAYTMAWVARYGLLAMRRSEAVYFIKRVDENGDQLTENCDYQMEGQNLPGEWWSFTVYDKTGFLPQNTDAHLSFDATEAQGADTWSVRLSSRAPSDESVNWISTKAGGHFDVTMRIYLPQSDFIAAPKDHLTTPTISKISCEEAA